ncbi:MAG: ribonuclease P protein component [Sulfurovum sp.]|nr:MAG: ribonuclease P protein component [Sulfurovum sp.]
MKTTKEFNNIYNNSKVVHTPWFVIFYQKNNLSRVGIVASKKVGNAVSRNRAKRVLKAHFIETLDLLENGSYILVAKLPILQTSYEKRHMSYIDTFKRLKLLKA